jgi:putative ABC transport system substrate-binding protein
MMAKIFIWLLATVFLTTVSLVEAQQPKKTPRIGFLSATYPSTNTARIEAFRQGLRELGYTEGENIVIEYRWAEGKTERLPELAAELVRLKVAIIVTAGPTSTRPAKGATTAIPIVMAFDNDPVGSGFVVSLARPGGNVTGLSAVFPELSGKRAELLKEVIPKLSRIAAFGTSSQPGAAEALRETERAAAALALKLQSLDIRHPANIETAFQAARKGRADAILVLSSPVIFSRRTQIADLAVKNRLPMIFPSERIRRRRRVDGLRAKLRRLVPARRHVCRQDSQRSQAGRSPRGATKKV